MASENSVFSDSPLGVYLKSVGDDIVSESDKECASSADSSTSSQYAPSLLTSMRKVRQSAASTTASSSSSISRPSFRSISERGQAHGFRMGKPGLRTFSLGNKRVMRKLRFQFLFSTPLKKRLGPRENSQFLERFRYILVTSQLLDENPSVAGYGQTENSSSQPNPQNPFDNTRTKNRRFAGIDGAQKYWVGSGGCVIVVAMLFSWMLRSSDKQAAIVAAKYRVVMALILFMIVFLFLHAHSWRKRLRSTRRTAVSYASQFVKSSHSFDANVSRTIGIVQEIEFISKGFNLPSLASSPASYNTPTSGPSKRRRFSGEDRSCRKLRSQIVSVLDLSLSLCLRSFEGLSELCDRTDLEKYFEIYDLNNAVAEQLENDMPSPRESEPVMHFGDFEDSDDEDESSRIESLFQLKQKFRKLHHTRRKLICCFLAMDASGGLSDTKKWNSIVQELGTLSEMIHRLSEELAASLLHKDVLGMVEFYAKAQQGDEEIKEGGTVKSDSGRINRRWSRSSAGESITSESRWRSHLQTLNSLSATLRNLEAKMYVLREDSSALERQDVRWSQQRGRTSSPVKTASIDGFLERSNSDMFGSPSGQQSAQGSSSQFQYVDNVIKQYESIGMDMRTMLREWETGKAKLYEAIQPFTDRRSGLFQKRSSGLWQPLRPNDEQESTSPSMQSMSSPTSMASIATFDGSVAAERYPPWSPQSFDGANGTDLAGFTPRVRNPDNDDDDDDDDDLILETEGTPLPLPMKSKMVDEIASAMVRQQDRILRAQRMRERDEDEDEE
ncbi:Mysoin-binding motif of peroxisomes-domain-containing protein [Myxozyma melibiosi]|uniref:Mysoin-binding motif of peroxisomes-domain-containing protein n=1 Tax=Myxozyma melibiosi TaxID=54550 RepID=A0ABR1F9R8_9ASCO